MKQLLLFFLWVMQVELVRGQDAHRLIDPEPPLEVLDLSLILQEMAADDFAERDAATMRFLEISRNRLADVSKALFKAIRTSDDPEIRVRAEGLFEKIFEFRVLGKGDSNLGVLWHWHIALAHEGEMRARPIVREIDPKSLAAAAGLKVGDIVCYVNGKELPRQDGIPALRKILRTSAPGSELELTVRACKFFDCRYSGKAEPNRKVVIKVVDSRKPVREARKGEFEKWLVNLKEQYDQGG